MSENKTKDTVEIEIGPNSEQKTSSNSNGKQNKIDFDKITKFLDLWLVQKSPSLPQNIKEFLFEMLPTLNYVSLFINTFLGFGAIISVFLNILYPLELISSCIRLAASCCALYFAYKAIDGLQKKEYTGWENVYKGTLLFYTLICFSSLTGVIGSPLMVLAFIFVIPVCLIFIALILYFIFQIRSYYNKKIVFKKFF